MDEEQLYTHCRFKNWEKLIESLLKEKDDNNCLLIIGNYKLKRLYQIK